MILTPALLTLLCSVPSKKSVKLLGEGTTPAQKGQKKPWGSSPQRFHPLYCEGCDFYCSNCKDASADSAGPFLRGCSEVFYTRVCSAGAARGRSYLWAMLCHPWLQKVSQEQQRSSTGRLDQLHWRSRSLGQQRNPPPLRTHLQSRRCWAAPGVPVGLLTQASQSGLAPCPIQDSWGGAGSLLGGLSLPSSAQTGYCCSKRVYWCRVASFGGWVEIAARLKLRHRAPLGVICVLLTSSVRKPATQCSGRAGRFGIGTNAAVSCPIHGQTGASIFLPVPPWELW